MVKELLNQIDVTLDIDEVHFSHSTFLPLPWSDNVDDIMDEYMKQPRLQTVTVWYLDSIGLSKIPLLSRTVSLPASASFKYRQ